MMYSVFYIILSLLSVQSLPDNYKECSESFGSVALLDNCGEQQCTGTHIGDGVILTASHCKQKGGSWIFGLENRSKSEDFKIFDQKDWIQLQAFGNSKNHYPVDLALAKIDIPKNSVLPYHSVASKFDGRYSGIYGYGTSMDTQRTNMCRQVKEEDISIGMAPTHKYYKDGPYFTLNLKKGRTANGDSGCQYKDILGIQGVLSKSEGELNSDENSNTFTNTTALYGWINSNRDKFLFNAYIDGQSKHLESNQCFEQSGPKTCQEAKLLGRTSTVFSKECKMIKLNLKVASDKHREKCNKDNKNDIDDFVKCLGSFKYKDCEGMEKCSNTVKA